MAGRLILGALSNQSIPAAGGNMSTVAGTAYNLPVQRYVTTALVSGTVSVPNNSNHAYSILIANHNITGSADSNALAFNSQGVLHLQGGVYSIWWTED